MKFADYLSENNLRAYQFAALVGIGRGQAYRLEKGEPVNLQASTIKKIIQATNGKVAAEDLL